MRTKDLFVRNKELRDQWAAWAKQEEFETILTFAKAELIESHRCNTDMLAGALAFQEILLTIGDEEPRTPTAFSSGFHHNPDKV